MIKYIRVSGLDMCDICTLAIERRLTIKIQSRDTLVLNYSETSAK